MDNDAKSQTADRVQFATAEALQAIGCPACGGGLDVQFVARGKKGKGAGSMSVMCRQCMWRVVSDGISSEPPWVKALGTKFQTAASQNEKRPKPTVTV